MVAVDLLYGPMCYEHQNACCELAGTFYGFDLNGANLAAAAIHSCPRDGTVTAIGVDVLSITGNPPPYSVALTGLNAFGQPDLLPFGGSAIEAYDFTATGMVWVTLTTPAAVTAGDLVAACVWSGGVAPDAGNCIETVFWPAVAGYYQEIPRENDRNAVGTWSLVNGPLTGLAFRYSDGEIVGEAAEGWMTDSYDSADTPDEIGAVIELPFSGTCYGCRVGIMDIGGYTASWTACFYDSGDNLLASVPVTDANYVDWASGYAEADLHWTPVEVESGTYRLTIRADHATETIAPYGFTFDSAADRTSPWEGARWQKTERTDGGSWTDTDTELPWMGLWFSELGYSPPVSVERPPRVSYHRSVYLPISLWKPTISSYDPRGEWVGSLEAWDAYQHTITRIGGYWSAEFVVTGDMADVDWWLDEGLGLHVEVHDEAQVLVWEGFVDRVEASVGALTVTRGPLMGVANRIQLRYTQVTFAGAVVGDTWEPGIAAYDEDTDSHDRYGWIWRLIQGDRLDALEAAQIANVYLNDLAWPRTSKQWTVPGGGTPEVRVSCLGYAHFLDRYPYANAAAGGQTITSKIENVLDADFNGLFTSANADLAANTVTTKSIEDQQRSAWTIMQEVVRQGGPAAVGYGRYNLGVYGDRRVVYEPWPTELEYRQRIADPHLRTETAGGLEVMPWNVLPGRWLMFPDLLVGRVPPGTPFDRDQRVMMVREVTYRAPYGLELTQEDPDATEGYVAQIALRNQAW